MFGKGKSQHHAGFGFHADVIITATLRSPTVLQPLSSSSIRRMVALVE